MKNYKMVLVAVMLLAAAGLQMLTGNPDSVQSFVAPGTESVQTSQEGLDSLMRAFQEQRSKVWVEVNGEVSKILPDDNHGSRHQRLILRLPNSHTVLVAHNIDLTDKVPLKRGDDLSIRGRYEWNDRGGVLHWTHHDPKGHIKGGWIRHQGKVYQ